MIFFENKNAIIRQKIIPSNGSCLAEPYHSTIRGVHTTFHCYFIQVREVHEFFSDSVPLCSHLCSMNLSFPYENSMGLLAASAFLRIKQSIVGLLLQLKKKPTIRFVIQPTVRLNVKQTFKKTTATTAANLRKSCKSDEK